MPLIPFFIAGLVALGITAPLLPPAPGREFQSTASLERRLTSRIVVTVPTDDATLVVNGEAIAREGATRTFDTAPLDAGTYQYTFTVTWMPNTYTTIARSKTVAFRAGETVRVNLTVEDPADRVRVIYVPTPADVAAAMVDLAGVGRDDVVYEPAAEMRGSRPPQSGRARAGVSASTSIRSEPGSRRRTWRRQVSRIESRSARVMRSMSKIYRTSRWSSCTWETTSTCSCDPFCGVS